MTVLPLVMIPGMMADARVFQPQITVLGARMPVLIAVASQGDSIGQMVDALIPALPPRFAMLGHGLGGDVAMELVRRMPEKVEKLVLSATDPLAEAPAQAAAREARIVAARAGRLYQAMAEEIPARALAPGDWQEEILALVRDMAINLGEAVFIRQSRALQRRPDQQKVLRVCKVPTLVLAGEADTLVPLRRQEFTASLMPHARLAVIRGAGHLPSLEQPEQVNEAIEAFLSGPVLLR